ncbi:MAG: enoyl-CoA hydratase/isomerase family protein [Candidatus Pelagadaptatus aseana]|uniref:enoyl-CoA hydratase/isomerase family protein n=1 Tax=Candidatus Pelagadaptatus aseana TaxID=3120508 RepID=UPI0039B3631F
MTEQASVLFEERAAAGGKKVAIATLNAERSLNSLSLEMIDLLQEKFTAWENDDSVACVFLQGAGDKSFCAGGDVVALHAGSAAYGEELPNNGAIDFFTREYILDHHIHVYSKPIVVWGNGIVMGGGLGLMSGASHRVVTENTRMAMPEVTIGLYPDVGGSWFLNRAPGRTGLFLGLTGASFNGADAKFVGLADRFVSHDQKAAVIDGLCGLSFGDGSLDASLDAHAEVSKLLHSFEKDTVANQPAGNVQGHFDQIQALTDADSIPELFAMITGYEGDDKWLSKAAAGLKNGCPITPYLVQEQLNRTKHLSLADVFRLELTMSANSARFGHFKEGVRALLIDKDRNPQWTPAKVDDVTPEQVAAYFVEPWDKHPLAEI